MLCALVLNRIGVTACENTDFACRAPCRCSKGAYVTHHLCINNGFEHLRGWLIVVTLPLPA